MSMLLYSIISSYIIYGDALQENDYHNFSILHTQEQIDLLPSLGNPAYY